MRQQNKELFESYEVRNWEFSPRIYKILGAAILTNLMVILVAGQMDLTKKGCDSPFVDRICQVIDTVYVGSMLIGSDSEFVSKEYVKNELEDADITYIDVSSETPPLKYPEGYFAVANPDEFAMMQSSDFSNVPSMEGFPMSSMNSISPTISNGTDLMSTPQMTPTPNPNAINGSIPESPFSFGGDTTVIKTPPYKRSKLRNYTPPKPPKVKNQPKSPNPDVKPDDSETVAKKEVDESADGEKADSKKEEPKQPDISSLPVAEDVINKKPLQDFGDEVLEKVAAKKVDLSKSFSVVMQGTITKNGQFDPKKSAYVKTDGDQLMIDVAKSAIEAIGDSGILMYLQKLDVEKISFTLVQDDKQIYAIISSDQKTDSKAKTVSSGLNFAIDLGKKTVKEEDTLALLNAAKVESQGKNFILNFKLDKPIAQQLINRQLQKAQEKRDRQPNSTAQTGNANLKTVK